VQLKNQIRSLFGQIKAGNLPELIVIASMPKGKKPQDTDAYLANESLNSLVDRLLPDDEDRNMNLVQYSGSDRSFKLEPVLNEMREGAFFGGSKVVVVRRMPVTNDKNGIKQILKREDWAPGNTLVLSCRRSLTPDMQKKITADEAVVFLDGTPPRDQEIPAILVRMAKRRGCTLEMDGARALLDLIGPILPLLWTEVCKLSDYVGERKIIGVDDVHNVCADIREHDIFGVVDAITAKNTAKALSELRRLFEQQIAPLQVLGLLANQYRRLLVFRSASDQGASMEEAGQAAGMMPWLARKQAPLAKRMSVGQSMRALAILKQADHDLKTLRTPDQLVFEGHVLRLLQR
jgi:DNA polymerase III delta subunit